MRQGFDAEVESLLNAVLSLHKADGRVFENIRARVSEKHIFVMDVTLPLEKGDTLARKLPNGLWELFLVVDPRYQSGLLGVPACFKVEVQPVAPGQLPRYLSKRSALGEDVRSDPATGLDFASEDGRKSAVAAYTEKNQCSEAALARTARVDPADLSKWKKGVLVSTSDKKTRIENALRNDEAPATKAENSRDS